MTRREWISGLPLGLALFDPIQGAMADQNVDSLQIAVAAEQAFGRALLCRMVERKPRQNVFISPLSVFLALHMAENGAGGATLAAMRKTLALPDRDAGTLNSSTAALAAALKSRYPDALSIANALWADRRFTLDAEFVKVCTTLFGARASSLDFKDPRAAAEINEWVRTETNGKIADIVTADTVSQSAVILTNAVYFAASWRAQFLPSLTQTAPFHLTGAGEKKVPMMHHPRIVGAYRAGNNFEGALLPYNQSSIFLYAMLPHAGKTPVEVLGSLDLEHLTDGPAEFDLDLQIPRFNLDFSASLAEYLEKLGMGVALHYPGADFSRMGSGQFVISDVIHKTRLEVDETGTVAAAATAVTMRSAAMIEPRPLKTLVFNRPFALLIGDSQTGAVLFAGAIENP